MLTDKQNREIRDLARFLGSEFRLIVDAHHADCRDRQVWHGVLLELHREIVGLIFKSTAALMPTTAPAKALELAVEVVGFSAIQFAAQAVAKPTADVPAMH